MKFARVRNDVVVDLFDKLDGQVHPDLHGEFVQVPDTTEIGFVKNGKKYEAPPPVKEEENQEDPPPAPSLSKLDFLRRFTRMERIALRKAATSNEIVADFMHMLELSASVSLDHSDVVEGLSYLEAEGMLDAGRKDEILATQP